MEWNGLGGAGRPCVVAFLTLALMLLAAPPAFAKCELQQVAELHVLNDIGSPIVEGEINGVKVPLVVDTGANFTTLFRDVAERLKLSRKTVSGGTYGVGGQSASERTTLARFRLGALSMQDFAVLVTGDSRRLVGAAGLVGWDFLSQWDVEFDLAHHAIRLLHPQQCKADDLPYWAQSFSAAPLSSTAFGENHIEAVVLVNGRRIEAYLDSGATTSVLTPSGAITAGLQLPAGAKPDAAFSGIGDAAVVGWRVPLETFEIGGEAIRHTEIIMADLFGHDTYQEFGSRLPERVGGMPQMLLGADFLRSHRLLVATDQRLLEFTYAGGAIFDTDIRRFRAPAAGSSGSALASEPPKGR